MDSKQLSNIGAWEDVPYRLNDRDLLSVNVDAGDAFVMTRLDGLTTTADLCNITGLGERKTIEALKRLLEAGLVGIREAIGTRRMIVMRERKSISTSAQGTPRLEAFHGVDPDLARWLNAQGSFGQIPGQRLRGRGVLRFGGMRFDTELLKELDWLTVERKKEILFLEQHRTELDHFEFFGIEPTIEKRTIREAFSDFSRRFHPDTFFRRDLGSFAALIETVFKHGTQIYEWLNADETRRERYVQALNQRDESVRKALDKERLDKSERERTSQKDARADRKVRLQERLDQNAARRKTQTRDRAVKIRTNKAVEFYEEGKKRLDAEAYAAAYNAFRLANQYDPGNEIYQTMLEKAGAKMKISKAEQVWKKGYLQESLGNFEDAMTAYLDACEIWPRHEYCSHIAELLLRFDENLHKAEDLGRKAVQAAPNNVSYRMLLGRIYERSKLSTKARAEFEKVLELDPKNTDAKRALKGL